MSVKAIRNDYHGDFKDRVAAFHGEQLISVCWEKHTMMGWPMCLMVSPQMSFGELIEKRFPGIYGQHPDFVRIDWSAVQWSTAAGPFAIDMSKSISTLGLRHKSLLRFRTPGLDGYNNAG